MRTTPSAALRNILFGRGRKEDGQALILAALAIVVLLAFAGLAIDLGRVYVAGRQLQQAVDAASLAASTQLETQSPTASDSALTTAQTYSASAGNLNVHSGMTANALVANPASGQSGVTFLCLGNSPANNTGSPCLKSTSYCSGIIAPATVIGCNAVKVVESASVNTPFLGVLGLNFAHFNRVSATSTASIEGGLPHPLDIAIVVDTSPSMRDTYCNATIAGIANNQNPGNGGLTHGDPLPNKLDCAKQGIRALYQSLLPCAPDLPTCGLANGSGNVKYPDDEASLMVFPGLANGATDTSKEYDCVDQGTYANPSTLPVAYPAGGAGAIPNYQIVPFQSDYRINDATTSLTPGSRLVQAVWWTGQGCAGSLGLAPGNDVYGIEATNNNLATSFTGAITTAQAALAANATANPGRHAQPVIIFLSDGEANTGSNTPCLDAFNAAKAAKTTILPGNTQGTWFYSIVYDSHNNCTDRSGTYQGVSGLQLMKDMATNTTSFYFNQPAAGDLTQAFKSAGAALTGTRLIPDGSS